MHELTYAVCECVTDKIVLEEGLFVVVSSFQTN